MDSNIQKLLDRIVPALQPEAVYLFGSRARGDATEDSDYDLLVVVPDHATRETAGLEVARAAIRGIGFPVDILPFRRTWFEQTKEQVGTIGYAAAREGLLVYGA